MLVYPGAGRKAAPQWFLPGELVCITPRVRTLSRCRGKPGGPRLCATAFLSLGASLYLVSPSPRLYLSLVLGNVNVTLLSKQAK